MMLRYEPLWLRVGLWTSGIAVAMIGVFVAATVPRLTGGDRGSI